MSLHLALRLRAFLQVLDKISYFLIIIAMLAMVVMVSLQVFWRYVLGSSIDSADELSRLFFIWTMFLAIPQGVKYSVHVGIDLLVKALNKNWQEILFRITAVAGAVLMAAVFYAAVIATADKWQELMPTISITAGVYYIAVLICAVHSFLHLILLAWMGSTTWGDLHL